jgi:hypothetical protein
MTLTPEQVEQLAAKAVTIAIANIGYGETTANNEGPVIVAMGGKPGQLWCAIFAGYVYEKGAKTLSLPMPFRRSAGAEQLALNMLTVGRKFLDPKLAKPGDYLLWKRKGGHHIAPLEFTDDDGVCHTIEANVGKFPSKIKRLVHDVDNEPHFQYFVSLRK